MKQDYGFALARERSIVLGPIGHRIVEENDLTRVWEVKLEPGEELGFHIHHHPYYVVSLGGGDNRIETIFGKTIATHEPLGHTVYIDEKRAIHKLTNTSDQTYLSRLIEFKAVRWTYDDDPSRAEPEAGDQAPEGFEAAFKEILTQTADVPWEPKSLEGLYQKMLWRNEETGASIALIKFDKGVGIPNAHAHASNQFMYCLSGQYRYIPTGTTLVAGSFYCNPVGSVHGPTIADETTIFLEMYDGPHYPVQPPWYSDPKDAT
ncbi:cupin domain-containing protein [Nitratireductor soli]|uniref:cupin domain-containing protein n=1 Tax=Nitratireductor soli TaxID=1670619 RepID=UPI000AF0A89D|nr:cupin domain-containing protein [Nitratireductor soli]